MKKIILIIALFLVSSLAYSEKLFIIHDYFNEFNKTWEKIKDQPQDVWKKNWLEFHLKYIDLLQDMSDSKESREVFTKQIKDNIDEIVSDLPKMMDRTNKNYSKISKTIEKNIGLLNDNVKIKKPIDLYLVFNALWFNGKEFLRKGEPSFAINLPFVDLKDEAILDLIVSHEGFHVLHLRDSGKELLNKTEGIVMREGLAVYATKILFQGKDDAVYTFLSKDDLIICKNKLATISKTLLKDLKSSYSTVDAKYFMGGKKNNGEFPPRNGYYVGLKVMETLAQKYSLKQLMNLKYSEYTPLIRTTLEGLK